MIFCVVPNSCTRSCSGPTQMDANVLPSDMVDQSREIVMADIHIG